MGRAVRAGDRAELRSPGYVLVVAHSGDDVGDLHVATVVVNVQDMRLQLAEDPPREPVRVHLDLHTDEQERHVERLVGLGATR